MKIKDDPRVATARRAVQSALRDLELAKWELEKEHERAAILKREASMKRSEEIAAFVSAGNSMAAAGRQFGISGTRVKDIIQGLERRKRRSAEG